MDCGSLNDPGNGSVNHTSGTTFGQTITYSCNTGYNLVGDSTRTCQATGEWSGSAPTCEGTLLKGNMALWMACQKVCKQGRDDINQPSPIPASFYTTLHRNVKRCRDLVWEGDYMYVCAYVQNSKMVSYATDSSRTFLRLAVLHKAFG